MLYKLRRFIQKMLGKAYRGIFSSETRKNISKPIKRIIKYIYKHTLFLKSVDKDMILFDSSTGLNYTGSPRAIYERMVELGLDKKYKCIWFFKRGKRPKDAMTGDVKMVTYGSHRYYHYMAKGKIWVFDARQSSVAIKRDNQHYIQIWHGTPLKKLALDMDNVAMAHSSDIDIYKENFRKNTSRWDYLVAQNEFSANIFRRCFDFNKTMLNIGYPRNDVLFRKNNPEDIANIKTELGLPLDKKIILYAPTWRDNEYDETGIYEFKPKLDFEKLRNSLPSNYVMAVKYHYLIGDKIDWSDFEGFVYPFNAQADISLLYLVSDEMITDYSSTMFDFSILHKPMYFYAYDLESYKDELRGFYFDFINEAPGPISQTTDELIADILKSSEEKKSLYQAKEQAFYDKFHTYENGNASDKIIELIEKIAKE